MAGPGLPNVAEPGKTSPLSTGLFETSSGSKKLTASARFLQNRPISFRATNFLLTFPHFVPFALNLSHMERHSVGLSSIVYCSVLKTRLQGGPIKTAHFLRYHIFAATTDIITRFLLKLSENTAENNKRQFF